MTKAKLDNIAIHSKSPFKTKLNYFGIRAKNLFKTKYIFVTSLLLLLFIISYGLIFTIGINTIVNENNLTYIYFLGVSVSSIINSTLVIYLVWKLFYDDNNDGVNKLEMRIGLTKQFMYFYRLLLIFLFTIIFLLGEYLLNAIFYGSSLERNSFFSFRLFISSFTWLAFIAFFTIFISLLTIVIFKSKFIIIFSAIISIVILFFSSISGNFISNRVVKDNNLMSSEKVHSLLWFDEYSLADDSYVSLGLRFTNFYQLYNVLKTDQKHNFLAFIKENYDENLTNEKNLNNIINLSDKDYSSLNEKLSEINDENPNDEWYTKISQELIKTKDDVLEKFGKILSNSKLQSNNSNFFLEENSGLKTLFYEYIFNSFLYCEQGIELDFISSYQIQLIKKFNQKMKKNAYLNPLYGLNLMFFGDNFDFMTDNLINRTRPIFKQSLNITFDVNYEVKSINANNGKTVFIINHSVPKKTIEPTYYVAINLLIFISASCLIYLGYQIKK